MTVLFSKRKNVEEIEEGNKLQPKFDTNGLIPVVTSDSHTKLVLMHGYMNDEAFSLSIKTGYAHYWSRSRKILWKKGETSGLNQKIIEMKIDDDQDCVWIEVSVEGNGASCHVGYKSCFYRKIIFDENNGSTKLVYTEKQRVFDPKDVYGDAPNPTKI
tara:strand:- start:4495 stop:4968 length:474 start_codon:yes stop_codon:yes gene_type:complete